MSLSFLPHSKIMQVVSCRVRAYLLHFQPHLHKHTHTKTEESIQHEVLWCNYFSFDVKNYSKSMRWKVFCSLSQELALFTSLQHIICSISQSQLFSLSYCHTHCTTVYHMPHLTRHACVYANPCVYCAAQCFYLFVFICMSVCAWMHLIPLLIYGNKHHLYTLILVSETGLSYKIRKLEITRPQTRKDSRWVW